MDETIAIPDRRDPVGSYGIRARHWLHFALELACHSDCTLDSAVMFVESHFKVRKAVAAPMKMLSKPKAPK